MNNITYRYAMEQLAKAKSAKKQKYWYNIAMFCDNKQAVIGLT